MFGYIYKTTNKLNGKIYIGQRKGTVAHYYLGSGKLIQEAIKEHGKSNFILEVLAFASNPQILNLLEIKYIKKYRGIFGKSFLYNLNAGGKGFSKTNLSEDHKRKLSIAGKGRKSYRKGIFGVYKHSQETKNVISRKLKNICRTKEFGYKISNARRVKIKSEVDSMLQNGGFYMTSNNL